MNIDNYNIDYLDNKYKIKMLINKIDRLEKHPAVIEYLQSVEMLDEVDHEKILNTADEEKIFFSPFCNGFQSFIGIPFSLARSTENFPARFRDTMYAEIRRQLSKALATIAMQTSKIRLILCFAVMEQAIPCLGAR